MKKTTVYSVTVPPDFSDRVERAKQILHETSNGKVLVYLIEQFEKSYADEIKEYERRSVKKEIIMEKPQEKPLF
jgi:hypothetical protein